MNTASVRQSLARFALRRQPIHSSKRFASSSESQQKKAQDALATAQKVSGKVFENVIKFLEPVGEQTGRLFGSYKQPLLYNLAVTREVIKQIYIREGLQPPSISTIRSAYASLWSQITSPGLVRNLIQSGQVGRVGVYGLQAYGIFKIGEILGRRSLIGYDLH
ncbi:hypothetical protein BYT27DRAFT_7148204 [Phlegmacium glaucopus]|nr:hypothetical protein BYT27DRAFT_7148204 [Phlegmacium glaucopus]